MLPYQMIAGGTFTTASTPVPVNLLCNSENPPDYFVMRNRTKISAATVTASANIIYEWYKGMSQDTALAFCTTIATPAVVCVPAAITTGGISCYSTAEPPIYAAITSTTPFIAKATGIVTMTNTGSIYIGDVVRVTQSTGMLQIAGMDFSVTAASQNATITLGYMNGSAYASDSSAGYIQKIIPNRFYPRWRYITSISQASQAVVIFSVTHNFTVGEVVSFRVSSAYGMSQMNNLQGTVQSVNTSTNSITVNIDSSGFTAFAFPTSAVAAAGVSPAVCVPSSSGVVPNQSPPGTNLLDAFTDKNARVIHLGLGVMGAASDVWDWAAYKYDDYSSTTV